MTVPSPSFLHVHTQSDLKRQVRQFSRSLPRPFHARTTDDYKRILVDRAVTPFLTADQQSNLATSARHAASAAQSE